MTGFCFEQVFNSKIRPYYKYCAALIGAVICFGKAKILFGKSLTNDCSSPGSVKGKNFLNIY